MASCSWFSPPSFEEEIEAHVGKANDRLADGRRHPIASHQPLPPAAWPEAENNEDHYFFVALLALPHSSISAATNCSSFRLPCGATIPRSSRMAAQLIDLDLSAPDQPVVPQA